MGSNSRISGDQFSLQLLDSHCNPTGNVSAVDTIQMEYHGELFSVHRVLKKWRGV